MELPHKHVVSIISKLRVSGYGWFDNSLQVVEGGSCSCVRLHDCHEALGNHAVDCFGKYLLYPLYHLLIPIFEFSETVWIDQRSWVRHYFEACMYCWCIKISRFPPGVINTVPSLGSVGGYALAAPYGVDKVTSDKSIKATKLTCFRLRSLAAQLPAGKSWRQLQRVTSRKYGR